MNFFFAISEYLLHRNTFSLKKIQDRKWSEHNSSHTSIENLLFHSWKDARQDIVIGVASFFQGSLRFHPSLRISVPTQFDHHSLLECWKKQLWWKRTPLLVAHHLQTSLSCTGRISMEYELHQLSYHQCNRYTLYSCEILELQAQTNVKVAKSLLHTVTYIVRIWLLTMPWWYRYYTKTQSFLSSKYFKLICKPIYPYCLTYKSWYFY